MSAVSGAGSPAQPARREPRGAAIRPATVVAALSAATLVRIALSGEFRHFVRPSMQVPLLVSGAVLGLMAMLDATGLLHDHGTPVDHDHAGDHERDHHDDHHDSVVSWLLLVPVLTLLVFAPPALSAWGASRQTTNRAQSQTWSPLTVTPGQPVELSMRDFVGRALDDQASTVAGIDVRLTGFVTDVKGDSFTLLRYSIACCAADALASSVVVTGVELPPLPVGSNQLTWVSVTGKLAGVDGVVPSLAADTATTVTEPRDPYDS